MTTKETNEKPDGEQKPDGEHISAEGAEDAKPGGVFPFPDLPPELRTIVYGCVIDTLLTPAKGVTAKDIEPTTLFQTCRFKFRYETAKLFQPWLKSLVKANERALSPSGPFHWQISTTEELHERRIKLHRTRRTFHHLYMQTMDRQILRFGNDPRWMGSQYERSVYNVNVWLPARPTGVSRE